MTMMAGVFSRGGDLGERAGLGAAIASSLSRDPRDRPIVFESSHCYMAKIDAGAYGHSAHLTDTAGNVSFMVGHPYFETGDGDRSQDLSLLHDAWSKGRWEATAGTNGVFAAAHYSPARQELTLVSDNLGVRQIYYYLDSRYLVFATSLRVLRNLPVIPEELDIRALVELTSLGYCLASRTPYQFIKTMPSASLLHVSDAAATHQSYWRWDSIRTSDVAEAELAQTAHAAFMRATSRRLRGEKHACALLSGGLDSRAVVASLRDLSASVSTFNFSKPATQDRVFASMYASRVGARHTEIDNLAVSPRSWLRILHVLATSPDGVGGSRRIVWSGDGGSVGLGHVHMSAALVAAMRKGEIAEACQLYLREGNKVIVKRLLRRGVARQVDGALEAGIQEEIASLRCDDPARNFYLFMMLNHQRRDLASHFEAIDLHRTELELPFYDTGFLRVICSVPLDLCLRHGFYMTWLERFPATTRSVPWQTYPGHLPCPLPVPEQLADQWSETTQKALAPSRGAVFRDALRLSLAPSFPGRILRRSYLAAAAIMHLLRIGDYRYVLENAAVYARYAGPSGRRPSPES